MLQNDPVPGMFSEDGASLRPSTSQVMSPLQLSHGKMEDPVAYAQLAYSETRTAEEVDASCRFADLMTFSIKAGGNNIGDRSSEVEKRAIMYIYLNPTSLESWLHTWTLDFEVFFVLCIVSIH